MGFLYFFHQRHMDQTLIISAFWCCRKAKQNKAKHLPRVTRISMRNSLTFFAFSHRCKALVVRRVWINDFSSIYFATLNYSWNFSLACIQYFLGPPAGGLVVFCVSTWTLNYAWIIYANCVLIWRPLFWKCTAIAGPLNGDLWSGWDSVCKLRIRSVSPSDGQLVWQLINAADLEWTDA